MPNNIHSFEVIKATAKAAEKESVLETIREALKQAEEGRIAAIGIAVVRPDGSVNSSSSDSINGPTLLGAITVLQHRMIKRLEDGAGNDDDCPSPPPSA